MSRDDAIIDSNGTVRMSLAWKVVGTMITVLATTSLTVAGWTAAVLRNMDRDIMNHGERISMAERRISAVEDDRRTEAREWRAWRDRVTSDLADIRARLGIPREGRDDGH